MSEPARPAPQAFEGQPLTRIEHRAALTRFSRRERSRAAEGRGREPQPVPWTS